MTDQLRELLWMAGCTAIMVGVGLIALVGYIRLRRANHESIQVATTDAKTNIPA